MHAPIILGLVEKLNGTMIKYYAERSDADITALVFEAGQHDDSLSINRAMAAVINCHANHRSSLRQMILKIDLINC